MKESHTRSDKQRQIGRLLKSHYDGNKVVVSQEVPLYSVYSVDIVLDFYDRKIFNVAVEVTND